MSLARAASPQCLDRSAPTVGRLSSPVD